MRASSWDTLVSCLAASIRAQRATASSRVMVMFLNRRMTRLQCYTDFVSPGSSGSPTSPQELPTIRLGDNGNTAASVAFSPDPGQRFLYVASRSPARIWVFDRKTLQALDSFGRPGIAPGEFDVLHHMTTDNKGNLYTSEVEDGRRVQKFVFKGLVSVSVPVS